MAPQSTSSVLGGESTHDETVAELRLAVMRLRRRLALERHPENELSISQMGVLAGLSRHGDLTLGELATRERVQPPSMTRTVNCLEEGGYVSRRPHESDGRVTVVELTAAGAEVLKGDRLRRDEWLERRLDVMSPEERDVLRRATPLLARLAQED